jgi:hypothetical protein
VCVCVCVCTDTLYRDITSYSVCVCVCVCTYSVCVCVCVHYKMGQMQKTNRQVGREADRQTDLLAAGEHAGSVNEGNVGEQGRRARGA